MPAYLVTLDRAANGGKTLVNGADSMAIFAADGAAALEAAAAANQGDGGVWSGGTATEIAAAATFIGWTFSIDVHGGIGVGADEDGNATVVGVITTADTVDEIGDLLVIECNALVGIAGSAYDSATQILTIASGAGGDDIGDKTITVKITPPGGWSSVDELYGAIVDGGIATDILSVVLPADAVVIPSVPVQLIQT